MSKGSNALFLVLFIGMTLTGAALILSIPTLFGPHEPYHVGTAGVLGGLYLAFAVGTFYLRPTKPRSPDRKADE